MNISPTSFFVIHISTFFSSCFGQLESVFLPADVASPRFLGAQPCYDKSTYCVLYSSLCFFNQNVQSTCPSLCNLCGNGAEEEEKCEDNPESAGIAINCQQYKDFCEVFPFVKEACRKTCKICKEKEGKWGEFGEYGECDAVCGDGKKTRTRVCIQEPCNGKSEESISCNEGPCEEPEWEPYGEWGQCSETCGDGIETRTRICNKKGGKANCKGPSKETRPCIVPLPKCPKSCEDNDERCQFWPLYCETNSFVRDNCRKTCDRCPKVKTGWGDFGKWEDCDQECGGGNQRRERVCLGGDCPGNSYEERTCNMQKCAEWLPWGEFSECTASCGGGTRYRTRKCDGSKCNGESREEVQCGTINCPPGWHDWEDWGKCSEKCGGGIRTRTRKCRQEPCEGHSSETELCNEDKCKINCENDWGDSYCNWYARNCKSSENLRKNCAKTCKTCSDEWNDWEDFEPCTETCGISTKTRKRSCKRNRDCSGPKTQTITCFGSPCVDNGYGPWGLYGVCSETCGEGIKTKTRQCLRPPCIGPASQNDPCIEKDCPQPYWTNYGNYGPCDKKCGGGTQIRTRECIRPPGTPASAPNCEGEPTESRVCNKRACPEPYYEDWSRFGPCNVECGEGLRTRTRTCVIPELAVEGATCSGSETDTKPCNLKECEGPYYKPWDPWTECTASCEGGKRTRTRSCVVPPGNPAGATCSGPPSETGDCNVQACPYWKEWEEWSRCTKECGLGKRTRTRECEIPQGTPVGGTCPPGEPSETEDCNVQACPEWTDFGDWENCQKTCGVSTQLRRRKCEYPDGTIADDSLCDGQATESRSCNLGICPVPVWEEWVKEGECNKYCGGGKQKYTRICTVPQGATGTCNGKSEKTENCNQQKCVDPKWTTWEKKGKCSESCGGGQQIYERVCQKGSDPNEECKGSPEKSESCNKHDCPVPKWSNWSSVGTCSKQCNTGKQKFTRTCTIPEGATGTCEGLPEKEENCNVQRCKAPKWSEWVKSGECSEPCEGGKQKFTRTCDKVGSDPEDDCEGDSFKEEDCNMQPCKRTFEPFKDFAENVCSAQCGRGVKYTNEWESGRQYRKYTLCNAHSCPTIPCPVSYVNRKEDYQGKCCKVEPSDTCGKPVDKSEDPRVTFTSRIIGGRTAQIEEMPWQVLIMIYDQWNRENICGGTIISDKWVVTAGHCVKDVNNKYYTIRKMKVLAGQSIVFENLRSTAESNVEKVIAHDSYDYPVNDIALLKTTTRFDFSISRVKPACLPHGEFPPQDETCFIAGFGISDNKNPGITKWLQVARIQIFHNEICKAGYRNASNVLPYITNEGAEKLICAGTIDSAQDSCSGDSGGPLVCQRRDSCQWYLAGLTSFGPSPCAKAKQPGMYTSVTYFEDWIRAVMDKE